MAATLLLDRSTWDLCLDAQGNIAVATAPYALAQDAASAIMTVLGTCWWDTTVGVNWSQFLGATPQLAPLKAALIAAALTVPDVASAQVYFNSITDRIVSGQVQITAESTGQTAVAPFQVVNPQGV
jgi:hypothetical protein